MTVQDYLLKFRKLVRSKVWKNCSTTLTIPLLMTWTLLICIALQITAVPNWFPEDACLM